MFKKLSVKILIVALLVLIGVVLIFKFSDKKEKTFRSKVVEIDPYEITAMEISDPKKGQFFRVEKLDSLNWKLNYDGKEYSGDRDGIIDALHRLDDINTDFIASTKESKWDEYQVSDTTGIRVKLFQDGDIVEDIYIGKFSYKMNQQQQMNPNQQQQPDLTSYVRPESEDNVYAFKGVLRMSFAVAPGHFRNKSAISQKFEKISKLTYKYPEKEFSIDKMDGRWYFNGVIPADSAKTMNFVRSISRTRNSKFLDDIDVSTLTPTHQLIVEGEGFSPIIINAYPSQDTLINYYITSSYNPKTVWNGKEANMFNKLFKDKEEMEIK